MSLAAHAAIGALIATRFPNHPVLGFCLAFGSHFLMDAIPHFDYDLKSLSQHPDPMKTRVHFTAAFLKDASKVIGDFLLGLAVGILFLWSKHPVIAVAVGAFAGALPDGLQFLYFKFQKEPLKTLQHFHVWIHTKNKMKDMALASIAIQAAIVLACYFSVRIFS